MLCSGFGPDGPCTEHALDHTRKSQFSAPFLHPHGCIGCAPFLLPPFRPVLLVVASIVWTGMYPAFRRDQGRRVSRPASYSAGLVAEHEAGHARPAECRRAPLSRRRFARHMLRRTLILNRAGYAGGPAAVSDEGGRPALIDCNSTRHLTLVRVSAECNYDGHLLPTTMHHVWSAEPRKPAPACRGQIQSKRSTSGLPPGVSYIVL